MRDPLQCQTSRQGWLWQLFVVHRDFDTKKDQGNGHDLDPDQDQDQDQDQRNSLLVLAMRQVYTPALHSTEEPASSAPVHSPCD